MGDAALAIEAVDFTLLDAPFTGTPVPIDETEGPDPRMEAITGLVAKGSYADAARAAEALLRSGVRDVRLLGPYLFGHFVADGMKALPVLFRSLSRSLTENWDAFGPPGKKPIFVDTGLRWLLKMMSKTLEHHTRLKDAQWQAWNAAGNREPIEEALRMGDPLIAALGALPKSACVDPLRTLLGTLRSHAQGVPYLPPPEDPQAKALALAPDEEDDDDEDDGDDEEVRPAAKARRRAAVPEADAGPSLPMSPALAQLVRKLSAFEALVAKEDFVKASVIAVDVLATVERFDPRVYLPMLFSGFFNGLSQHADAIEPMLHGTETLGFRALDQLYRVDLDAFLVSPPRQARNPGYEE
ncbi:type VI secretion system protein IglI family protein [Corallococcus sp. bb12-1]|uniref:type VI secretion system protein IglI family protein n=1 Tax=Corallococcus sp. bb12-1 TaxID=2996784 RepID=UPI00226D5D78|nr:type VI secretion system protein IglI family protein [Corallococcus sp. bb12-1]MCY1041621.1 type VI secretion system protein IglI family protein [Corallococcus sp. bb12-1]